MPELSETHTRRSAAAPVPSGAPRRGGTARSRLSPSRRRLKLALVTSMVVLGAAGMLFPFLWTLITSLQPNGSGISAPSLVPGTVSGDGYRTLLHALPFTRVAVNSLWLALVSTVVQIVTSSMAAYAFSRLRFCGRGLVFGCYLATMMIPLQVLIVPLFAEMKALNLVDTYAAVLAPTLASGFGVFLLRQAMDGVPRELDEAARLDGAGHLWIFGWVVLPLVRPALATFSVFAFMASWNSFLWPLVIIRSPEFMTLPLALAGLQGQFSTQWNVAMAGSVLGTLPIVILYLFTQKYVVQSVARSGLK
ncbi:carbohydrate ABC transporter permease [Streptomyces sp. NPDC020490]|uniref:carbohydrate ABC transporter permease n=1 Tax=Streptomyces sp. NPDC020490 TaxID=3365078 RepID=UPI0037878F97